MTPLRVCVVVHEGRRSGPPLFALGVVDRLAHRDDLDLSVVLLEGGELVADFAARCPTEVRSEDDAGASALLRAADVVYVNTAVSIRALREEGYRPPAVVTHVHELEIGLRYWLSPEDHRWLLAETDRFLVGPDCAEENLVRHHGVHRAKIGRVPYFVPPGSGTAHRDAVRRALGAGPDAVVVGACGAREWRKAPDLFAQVAWWVWRQAPDLDLRFVWVGSPLPSGPHWDEDAELALLGLGDRLRYVDDQADIDAWLAAFDLYALTSREDDFPLACLTACSFGVPVVTFDTGGMADLARASGGGRVVPYPEVERLAAELVELARSDADRERLGDRIARFVADHHDLDRSADVLAGELLGVVAR